MKAAGGSGRTWVGPNRNTLGFVALLAAMGYAGAGQTNAAAYLLAFLLLAIAAVSIAHAYANLRGVRLSAGPVRPVFVGEDIHVCVTVTADDRRPRFGLELRPKPAGRGALVDFIADSDGVTAELALPAVQRGLRKELSLEMRSSYPLGWFTARRRITLHVPHTVYPRAAGAAPFPAVSAGGFGMNAIALSEGDDFAGLRAYQPGESQRHIDWKAVARGQPLLTRQWAGTAAQTVMLDLAEVPAGDLETRLSQLARWIVVAEREKLGYGLRLGATVVGPSSGEAHLHDCLRMLAMYGPPDVRQ